MEDRFIRTTVCQVDQLHVEFHEIKTEQCRQCEAELWKQHHQTDEG